MTDTWDNGREAAMEMISTISRNYLIQAQRTGEKGQGKILSLLYDSAPMSLSMVADRLGIMTGSASEMVNKLEHKGLVTKGPDGQDKRKIVITLSPEGERQALAFRSRRAPADATLSCLNDDEILTLQILLKKVITNMEKESHGIMEDA